MFLLRLVAALALFLAPMAATDAPQDEIKSMLTTLITEVANLQRDVNCLKARQSFDLTRLENDKLYHFSKIERRWDHANEFCKSKRMELASPKRSNEVAILKKAINDFAPGEQWWLSATDKETTPGNFSWHDGEVIPKDSDLWDQQEGEPNDFGNRMATCVALHSSIHRTSYYKLRDFNCFTSLFAICESTPEC